MRSATARKIAGLVLMASMAACVVSIGIPGVMPAAAQYLGNVGDVDPPEYGIGGLMIGGAGEAPVNLLVSAVNSQSNSYVAGPQVIEVIVDDPGISDTDEGEGEPDVEINGSDLRMVQATDGRWYAYFASLEHARTADGTTLTPGKGLDYGSFCSSDTAILGSGVAGSDGIAIPIAGGANGDDAMNDCSGLAADGSSVSINNVVRRAKAVNENSGANGIGQIGLAHESLWPFIQLYTFSPADSIIIDYNRVRSTTLVFDAVEGFADMELDRAVYPPGSHVHVTVTDAWLNIDPTDEDSWTWETAGPNEGDAYYDVFGAGNAGVPDGIGADGTLLVNPITSDDDLMQGAAVLLLDASTQGSTVMELRGNRNAMMAVPGLERPVTLTEQGQNSGTFGTYDESDDSLLVVADDARRGDSATIRYSDDPRTVLVGFGSATLDILPVDGGRGSGREVEVVLVDGDANKNSRVVENLLLSDPSTALIPSLVTGDPFTLGEGDDPGAFLIRDSLASDAGMAGLEVQPLSERAIVSIVSAMDGSMVNASGLLIDLDTTMAELRETIQYSDTTGWSTDFKGYNLLNYDVDSLTDYNAVDNIEIKLVKVGDSSPGYASPVTLATGSHGLVNLSLDSVNDHLFNATFDDSDSIGILYTWSPTQISEGDYPIVTDFFSFGFNDDGDRASERVANQIIRFEMQEHDHNSDAFVADLGHVVVNQLNILDESTYETYPISDDPSFVVVEDLTGEDSPRIDYLDLGADGVSTQIAERRAVPSHSGVVSFDSDTYKVADTVTVRLDDADMNADGSVIDIFTVVKVEDDPAFDMVGVPGLPELAFGPLGGLLEITFDDQRWLDSQAGAVRCNDSFDGDDGLGATGIRMIETGADSGTFVGYFQIPTEYCARSDSTAEWASVVGTDIEVNYVDFMDASGKTIEVGDSASIRAYTGTVSLDRTVYPIPWGLQFDDGSIFPLHATAIDGSVDREDETLGEGVLTIYARVSDQDFNVSASYEDVIETDVSTVGGTGVGPVRITVSRGGESAVIAYAGGKTPGNDFELNGRMVQDLGPISEISPDAGVFELDFTMRFDDGPEDSDCPTTATGGCILRGDILTVEYVDPTDVAGDPGIAADSAIFDLRDGALRSDKLVYIIGSNMILTVIETDWNLDGDAAETYDLDVLGWDSGAATTTMGDRGIDAAAFDPEPAYLWETGDGTGIFQVIVKIPAILAGDRLGRGEQVVLEYIDWGPSRAGYVGEDGEAIGLDLFTSIFGATVELDQKVYT